MGNSGQSEENKVDRTPSGHRGEAAGGTADPESSGESRRRVCHDQMPEDILQIPATNGDNNAVLGSIAAPRQACHLGIGGLSSPYGQTELALSSLCYW